MIDSHTHLLDERFNPDRDEIILKSVSFGIKRFLEVLTSPYDWGKWQELQKYEEFFFAFGIHPHNAQQYEEKDLSELLNYLSLKRCVAIGEAGVDLWYYPEKLHKQMYLLERILDISYSSSKPLILHIRNSKKNDSAYRIVYNFLETRKKLITKRGIVHSFGGSFDEAKRFVDLGFFIGVNATITYPKNYLLEETVRKLPLDCMLTETDSPYLPPQTIRGRRNEPGSVRYIIEKISEIKSIKRDLIEEAIDSNFTIFLAQST